MTEFIFMLTSQDRTIPDALDAYRSLEGIDALRYVGFKDVGATTERLRTLAEAIHADGREALLEVVSEDADAELRSIAAAREVGVDWVLGGTHVDAGLATLAGTDLRYCPFPGQVVGHPSVLRGSIEGIAADAASMTARPGVHGLDLLAYRHDGDVPALVAAVVAASRGPVIAAGSVDSPERIRTLARLGVWGFTIGGAIFEGRFAGAPDVATQVRDVLSIVAEADRAG
jgi:hypothetical protein